MTFTVQESDLERVLDVLKGAKKDIGYFDVNNLGSFDSLAITGNSVHSAKTVVTIAYTEDV